jgi:Tol biopolymer transport system component
VIARGAPGSRRLGAGVAFALLLAATPALAGPGDTTLVSRQSQAAGGLGGDANSTRPALSANGRFVAFATSAGNLGGPTDAPVNIYVYDRERKRVELVSRQSRGAGGAGADNSSFDPAISANGRFVAFRTSADNLGGPIDADSNIYVYDRERDRVEMVSRRGPFGGAGNSEDPVISANGRFVAFQTLSQNLGGPLNDPINHYVYDRKRDKIELVSRQSRAAGGEGQDGSFFDDYGGSLSANGRFFAWETPATNLGGPAGPYTNVYVYDRERNRVQLVSRQSRSAGGEGGVGNSGAADLSAGGRFVAFQHQGADLGGPAEAVTNVYVYDRKRKRVQLVSRESKAAGGDGHDYASSRPAISADGRIVAFETFGDLAGPAEADVGNVFAYDTERKVQRLVSRESQGPGGDDFSDAASIAGRGHLVAFQTSADNLGGPIADVLNVYVHQLPRR